MSEDLGPLRAALGPAVESARSYAASSRAENTKRTYRAQWEKFMAWCERYQVAGLPASSVTVAAYIAELADSQTAASSIDVALAAISQAHELAGAPNPRGSAEVREVRRGIRRRIGTAPSRKEALTVAALRAMVEKQARKSPRAAARNRALLLIGFASGCRRSELAALNIVDARFVDQGVELTVRRSKTDQEGAGRAVAIPFGDVPETCPVAALRYWIDLMTRAGYLEGPLFRQVSRQDYVRGRLSDRGIAELVKRHAAQLGFDPNAFGGHSLRRGLVTAANKAGKSRQSIKGQTGHRSDRQVDEYVQADELFTNNAAKGIGL